MAKKMYEETRIAAIAEKIREHTKTETKYTTAEMPSGVDEVYTAGVEAGKAQGGGGDPYGIEEMLTRFPFLDTVETVYDGDAYGVSGLIMGNLEYGTFVTYEIVPPWVKTVQDDAFSACYMGKGYDAVDAIIFLSKIPPYIGSQSAWTSDGGCLPPNAIFVPDESIEAYKATTNLAEFAYLIKPLSEYNGEGYYGGLM